MLINVHYIIFSESPKAVRIEDSAIVLKLEDAGIQFADTDLVYR